ncbi:permease-like cell division protein FtsX [Candidatus Parcubacteria bacterium]|nr:permease-like cell division protein FtsX [Candidatus Parcubacteria bacterium]
MFLSFIRIIKFSLQDIGRNIWLSLVTIIIMVLALFTVNMLLVVKVIGGTAVDAIKEKIDVNLFIKSNAVEDEILALKAKVSRLEEVRDVVYVSKVEALENFKRNHADNPEILESLRELGANPMTPSLVIRPNSLDEFDNLINKINAFDDNIIESRNFSNYKVMLNKINTITEKVANAGLLLSGIFIFITILVVYNSVRVAIYTHRREIVIMRLVGASRWFIQMPYLLSGVVYTIFGIAIIMGLFYPFLTLLQPYLETFFVGYNVNLINYFYSQAHIIFGLQFVGVAIVNIIASQLAVRKYSRV